MIRVAFALGLLAVMALLRWLPEDLAVFEPARVSIGYGFLLLEAFLLGEIAAAVRLPRLSGYILAGILCGPYVLDFIDAALAGRMKLIDDLALTFIALTAGAELQLSVLRERARSIGWLILVGIFVVLGGTAGCVWLLRDLFPFARGAPPSAILALGVLFGVICVARSPTSAIAIIRDCRARGPFTDTVFGVTVAVDSLVILLFAVAMAVGEAMVFSRQVDLGFILTVIGQLIASLAAGVVIGGGVSFYIKRIEQDLTILLVVLSFLVTYTSRWLSHAMVESFDMSFHLEPLLIATAAGFVVQNYTGGGKRLVEGLHAVSLPIFVVFFSMAGVNLDLGALSGTWVLALLFALLRMILLSGSSYVGSVLAGEGGRFGALSGLTFFTQAGVSLGLTQILAQRYPAMGPPAAAFLVAVITLNQIVGPVTFKFALDRMGESGRAGTG